MAHVRGLSLLRPRRARHGRTLGRVAPQAARPAARPLVRRPGDSDVDDDGRHGGQRWLSNSGSTSPRTTLPATTSRIACGSAARRGGRARIRNDLDATLFVEAGAGAGKTSSLVDRIVNLVDDGVDITGVAAITFTEKAAAELRTRVRSAAGGTQRPSGRAAALERLDHAPIGTLHAFARRVLFDFPIEAGPPAGLHGARRTRERPGVRGAVGRPARPSARRSGTRRRARSTAAARSSSCASSTASACEPACAASPRTSVPTGTSSTTASRSTIPDRCVIDTDRAARPGRRDHRHRRSTRRPPGGHGRPGGLLRRDGPQRRPACRVTLESDPGRARRRSPARRRCRATRRTGRSTSALGEAALEDLRGARVRVRRRVAAAARRRPPSAPHAARRDHRPVRARRRPRASAVAGRLEFHDLLVLARRLVAQRARHPPPPPRPLPADPARRVPGHRPDPARDRRPAHGAPRRSRPRTPIGGSSCRCPAACSSSATRNSRSTGSAAPTSPSTCVPPTRSAPTRSTLTANFRSTAAVIDFVNDVFGRSDHLPTRRAAGVRCARRLSPRRPARPRHGHRARSRRSSTSRCSTRTKRDSATRRWAPPTRCASIEARDVVATITTALADGWPVFDEDARRGSGRASRATSACCSRPGSPCRRSKQSSATPPCRTGPRTHRSSTPRPRCAPLLLALRAADDPTDSLALVASLRSPLYGCSDVELWEWADGGRYVGAVGTAARRARGSHPVADAIAHVRSIAERSGLVSPADLLAAVADERRVFDLALAGGDARDVWRRLRYVIEQARAWADAGGHGLRRYLHWAALQASESRVADTILPEHDHDAVRVMTVHAAKGLEFPITIVAGLTTKPRRSQTAGVVWVDDTWMLAGKGDDGVFVDHLPIDEQMSDAERRRLLYVACTRAVDHLVVSLLPAAAGEEQPRRCRPGQADVGRAALARRCRRTRPPGPGSATFERQPGRSADGDAARTRLERSGGLGRGTPPRPRRGVPAVGDRGDTARGRTASARATGRPHRRRRARQAAGQHRAAAVATRTVRHEHRPRRPRGAPVLRSRRRSRHRHARPVAVRGRGRHRSRRPGRRPGTQRARARRSSAVWSTGSSTGASCSWRRTVGDRVLEGYVDLLVRTPDGLVIVDYKTDQWSGPSQTAERLERYRLQLAAYGAALESALGEPIAGGILVRCVADGAADQIAVERWADAVRRGPSARQLILVGRAVAADPHRTVIRHRRHRRAAELEHALAGEHDRPSAGARGRPARRRRSRSARRSWRGPRADRRTAGSSRPNRRRCRRPSSVRTGSSTVGQSTATVVDTDHVVAAEVGLGRSHRSTTARRTPGRIRHRRGTARRRRGIDSRRRTGRRSVRRSPSRCVDPARNWSISNRTTWAMSSLPITVPTNASAATSGSGQPSGITTRRVGPSTVPVPGTVGGGGGAGVPPSSGGVAECRDVRRRTVADSVPPPCRAR